MPNDISPEELAKYRAQYAANKNTAAKPKEYKAPINDDYSASIETVSPEAAESEQGDASPESSPRDLIAASGMSPEDVKRYQGIIRAKKAAESNETEHPYRTAFNNALYGAIQSANKLRGSVNEFGDAVMPPSIRKGEDSLRKHIEEYAPKTAAYLKNHKPPDVLDEEQFRKDYNLPEEAQGPQALARQAPEIIASLIAPEAKVGNLGLSKIPVAGKYLEKVLANALPQSMLGAAFNEGNRGKGALVQGAGSAPGSVIAQAIESKSPWLRAMAQFAGRGLSADAAYQVGSSVGGNYIGLPAAVAGALVGPRAYMAKSEARHDFLKNLPLDKVEENLAAAKKLGIRHLTPGEASGDKYTLAKEAELGSTHEGSKILQGAHEERAKTEEKAVTKVLTSMYHEGESVAKDAAYKQAYRSLVPAHIGAEFRENDAISAAEGIMLRDPALSQLNKKYPVDSIGYWDKVKTTLDDMHNKAAEHKKGSQAAVYDAARKEVIQKLESLPNGDKYKEGRGIAEREINKNRLNEAFDSKPMTGGNLVNAIKSKKGYAKLQHAMRDAPEAQEQLALFKKVFQNISDPDIAKQAAIIARNSNRSKNSTAVGLAKSLVEKYANGRYDKEAARLITDPHWYNEIAKLSQMGKGEKAAKQFVTLIGKVSAYEAAKGSSNNGTQ